MPRHAQILKSFFKDKDIKALLKENSNAVLLYLYYSVTSENLIGLYQTDEEDDRVSIRYPLKKFENSKKLLEKRGKLRFEGGWVWIVGKANFVKGPKQWASAYKLLKDIPDGLQIKKDFLKKYGKILIGYGYPIDGVSRSALYIPIHKKRNIKEKDISPDFLERANFLKEKILQNNPKAKVTESQIQKWADVVRLMVERDKRTLDEIDKMIDFSQKDEFWKAVILSMGNLRKNFDQLTMQEKRTKPKEATWRDKYGDKG